MATRKSLGTIDDYFAQVPFEVRPMLEKIRALVHSAVPGSEERISYRMPAFRKNKRIFFFFAAFTSHIGIYPPVRGDAMLKRDLEPYRGPKGNLKFPLDERLPLALIRRVAKALAAQYAPAPPAKAIRENSARTKASRTKAIRAKATRTNTARTKAK